MKTLRAALSLLLAASIVLLSPGAKAWATVVEIGHSVSAPLNGNAAGASVVRGQAANASALAGVKLGASQSFQAFKAPNAASFAVPSFAPSAVVPGAVAERVSGAVVPAAVRVDAPLPAGSVEAFIPAGKTAPVAAAAGLTEAAASFKSPNARPESMLERLFTGALRRSASVDAPALSVMGAASSQVSHSGLIKAADQKMPDAHEGGDGVSTPAPSPKIDDLGNPVRSGDDHGPDSTIDQPQRDGGSPLFGFAPGLMAAAAGMSFVQPLLTLPLVMISLILHEIGHAKVAAKLGDPSSTLEGRASFNPLKWYKHVDPMMTIVVPALTFFTSGIIFGGAKPVMVDSNYFKHPLRDMAKVALAGPAVNLALAALGALAFAGATAAGLGPIVLATLTTFVFVNALLAVFNLMPIPPLDGGHILLAVLPSAVADKVHAVYSRIGMLGMVPILVIAVMGGGFIMAVATGLTHLLIGASFAVTGVQLASAALPAMAALGMAIGSLKNPGAVKALAAQAPPSGPAVPGAAGRAEQPVEMVVVFKGQIMTQDLHLSSVDPRAANYVANYEGVQRGLLAELSFVGLNPEDLASYNATPIASYKRINAATLRVDAAKAAEFKAMLEAEGHKVYPNDRRIVIPKPIVPEDADPSARNSISMSENLKMTKADAVHAVALKRFGSPDLNPWQRVKRFFGAEQPAQPKIGVVDSGVDLTHPLLKRVSEVRNATAGENVDDIGHGSWVTSMVLNYAPWLKNLTHTKTFENGGATLDNILKALTTDANDGRLVINNSWGSDDGDPKSPDSVLVQKLAAEGHIMVFAAGNAGPGKNTIGSPAIVQYRDAATGAIRVVAVAATDRSKKVAFFSSRGPGSPATKGSVEYAHRPDLAAPGHNTEGAWPAKLGDADRTDPMMGPLKSISGTSMSTPAVTGAIALLAMMFGVTTVGPKLDAVVNAVMSTLEKTGKNGVDDEGDGFLNVTAAYEALYKQYFPGQTPPTAVARYRALKSDEKSITDYVDPFSEANRVAGQPDAKIVDSMLTDLKATQASIAALEAEFPGIAHHSAGWLVRAWETMTGRAPVPAHVREYRRLAARIQAHDEYREAFMHSLPGSTGSREEMLEYYENTIEPEFAADNAAFHALLKQYPNAEYDSAGTIGRWWMRVTGRAPKVS